MGLDEARERAERALEYLDTAIDGHEPNASPDAVLGAYAASANVAGMIAFAEAMGTFSDAVDRGAVALRQAGQTLLYDFLPALGRTLRNPDQ